MGNPFKPFVDWADNVARKATRVDFQTPGTRNVPAQAKPSGTPYVNPDPIPPPSPPKPNVTVQQGYRVRSDGQINSEPQFDVTRPLRQRIDPSQQGWTGGNQDFMRSRPDRMKSADPTNYKDSKASTDPVRVVNPEILGMPKPVDSNATRLSPTPIPVPDLTNSPTEQVVRIAVPWLLPDKGAVAAGTGAVADILLNPQPTGDLDPKKLFPNYDPLNTPKIPRPLGASPNEKP